MTIDDDGVIATPFLRTAYNYDVDSASWESGLFCEDPTLAQQQFAEECDINTIVERFGLTGQLPQDLRVPLDGDFADMTTDYQSALNLIMEADDAFMLMPAAIRDRFQNDAGQFVSFASDPRNLDQCREWGLARPVQAPQAPLEVRVIPTPPEPAQTPPAASNAV